MKLIFKNSGFRGNIAMEKIRVQYRGQEDPLEKEIAL